MSSSVVTLLSIGSSFLEAPDPLRNSSLPNRDILSPHPASAALRVFYSHIPIPGRQLRACPGSSHDPSAHCLGREGGREAVGKDAHGRQEETNSAALQWEAGLLARWL